MDVVGCLGCDLLAGRRALPGGIVHQTAGWVVSHVGTGAVCQHHRQRERSQIDRRFDSQPPRTPEVFTLGMWHWGTLDPHSARTGGRSVQTGGTVNLILTS